MILFVLTQRAPIPLLVLLAIMVYLAVIEVRSQDDMTFQVKVWWVMLVFLTNFPGLVVLRIYTFIRGRRRAADSRSGS
jgi:hypothetical protein